jgi:hypothetical protein
MTGTLLSLALASASIGQAAPAAEPPPSTGIRFLARTAYADGRSEYRDLRTISGPLGSLSPHSFYVSVPTTLCGTVLVSDHRPEGGSYVWHIGMGPVKYSPEARVITRGEVMVTAQRISGATVSEPKMAALPSRNVRRTAEIDAVTDVRPVAGCNAVALAIEARLLPEPVEVRPDHPAEPRLMEAELWFVHKAPDGKETSTRQALRLKARALGEFYFDDLVVNAVVGDRTEPVTIEVFGSLVLLSSSSDKDISATMTITRRYVNPKAIPLGIPPAVGKGTHHLTVEAGEVVSLVLPPLEGDKGAFLGHRFSVRMRLKPLAPEAD